MNLSLCLVIGCFGEVMGKKVDFCVLFAFLLKYEEQAGQVISGGHKLLLLCNAILVRYRPMPSSCVCLSVSSIVSK